MKEIKPLTSIRGIAALGVVFFHSQIQITHYFKGQIASGFGLIPGYIFVDLFFILSGFIMAYVHGGDFRRGISKTYFRFLTMRLVRVYPIHVIVLLIFFVIEMFYFYRGSHGDPIGEIPFSRNTLTSLIYNLLLIQAWDVDTTLRWNLPSWSVSAEWAAYLLTPIIFYIFLYQKNVVSLLCLIISLPILYVIVKEKGSLDASYDYAVPRCLVEYSLGVTIFRAYLFVSACDLRWQILVSHTAPISLLGAAISVFMLHNDLLSIGWFAASIFGLAVTHNTLTEKLFSAAIPMFLGKISYSLYMVHVLVITRAAPLLGRINAHFPSAGFWTFISEDLFLTTAAATILFYAVELPARSLGRRYLLGPSGRDR